MTSYQLLVASGRRANTNGFGCVEVGVTLGKKDEVVVNELINNAGISRGRNQAVGSLDYEVHPRWVQTDMGGPNAPVPTSESVAGVRQIIDRAGPHMSGQFVNWNGEALPS